MTDSKRPDYKATYRQITAKIREGWKKVLQVFKYAGACIILLYVLLCVLWWLLPDDSETKYALGYWIEADRFGTDQVVIERKPHNCEWSSAPLGDKHCHYKAIVTPLDQNGKVITAAGQTPTTVHVGWERVDE